MNQSEKIVDSLVGIKRAQAPDFFYTRLIGRMQHELTEKKELPFAFRPAFLTTVLAIVLFINIITLKFLNHRPTEMQHNNAANIQSFADAYNLNTTSLY